MFIAKDLNLFSLRQERHVIALLRSAIGYFTEKL